MFDVPRPSGFQYLLDYDGFEFVFEQGYVARFEFRHVEGASGPHPYRYSLTLHAPNGKRILGYDNAHPISVKSGKFRKRSGAADHWHRDAADKGRPYRFESPEKLLEDFYRSVVEKLDRRGVPIDAITMRKSQ